MELGRVFYLGLNVGQRQGVVCFKLCKQVTFFSVIVLVGIVFYFLGYVLFEKFLKIIGVWGFSIGFFKILGDQG